MPTISTPDLSLSSARARYAGRHPSAVLARLEAMEHVLERAVKLPLLGRHVGLDGIAGLVPVAGDVLTGAVGLYLLWEARNAGLSRGRMARMVLNVLVDTALGSIPVVGDAFDFVFRSNSANLKIIRRHLARQERLQAGR